MNRLSRYWMLLRSFLYGLLWGGYGRAEYLKKNGFFKHIGENCYLQPWNFGTEPHLISFGNNVHVASGVTFINHDISSMMFNYMDKEHKYCLRQGEIIIGNNVFIGANSTVLYDVTIGDNVIIGAGSLVNKNIQRGCIVAGVPAKVIGSFYDYMMKLRK